MKDVLVGQKVRFMPDDCLWEVKAICVDYGTPMLTVFNSISERTFERLQSSVWEVVE